MKLKFWHWPDHNIGKRESRVLREEHNAAMNLNADLVKLAKATLALPEVQKALKDHEDCKWHDTALRDVGLSALELIIKSTEATL